MAGCEGVIWVGDCGDVGWWWDTPLGSSIMDLEGVREIFGGCLYVGGCELYVEGGLCDENVDVFCYVHCCSSVDVFYECLELSCKICDGLE